MAGVVQGFKSESHSVAGSAALCTPRSWERQLQEKETGRGGGIQPM